MGSVLVIGYYGHGNLGDEAFKHSFRHLFPEHSFTFLDRVPKDLKPYDAIMVGGGSFLDQKIPGLERIVQPGAPPVGFIGVGLEGVTDLNRRILQKSKIVVTRSTSGGIVAPDLLFGRPIVEPPPAVTEEFVLVLANAHMMKSKGKGWETLGTDWIVSEMAQSLDWLLENNYAKRILFYPMCINPYQDDRRAAARIIDKMQHPNLATWVVPDGPSESDLRNWMVRCKLIISFRLHGLLFATALGKPFLSISGHDKMIGFVTDVLKEPARNLKYFGFSKRDFIDSLGKIGATSGLVSYTKDAGAQWQDIAVKVKKELFG